MAQSLGRSVSAQENNVNVNQDNIRDEYECTICLNWLNEPVVTSCGHRFCKACITSWLRKDESRCPIDSKELNIDKDIFADNFTKRQIDQLLKPCKNFAAGCIKTFARGEMDGHLLVCEYGANGGETCACTFNYCGCTFKGATKEELENHLKDNLNQHLEMLVTSVRDGQNLGGIDNNHLWDAPAKRTSNGDHTPNNHEQMDLIRTLYDRIVVLEQQHREQSAKFDQLTEQMTKAMQLGAGGGVRDGILIWRIEQFYSKIDSMGNNPNVMLYSGEAYTSPHGYKFCARLNISPKSPGFLGLHVHMMQSENDYHLDWPFKGRIKIQMIHPRGLNESQSDTIMSKPEILAFHRPEQEVSPRGFGFVEYACIQEIQRRGFIHVNKDTLIIKILVNLV